MPCSICGIHGHNKKTCGKSNNTMPKNSAFYGDYKQNVKQNWDYAKKEKLKTGQKGPVFKKNYAAMKKSPQKKANPFDGYCVFK